MSSNKRIFIGTSEVSGFLSFFIKSFQDLDYEVISLCDNTTNGYYDKNDFTYVIKDNYLPLFLRRITGYRLFNKANDLIKFLLRYYVFISTRNKCDIYIFLWNGYFINSLKDFQYLYKKGKKIISVFVGSDIRYANAFQQEYNIDISQWTDWNKNRDINELMFRLRKAELFSDYILSVPDQMGLAIRDYNMLYIPFHLELFKPTYNDRKIPKIVHIPSSAGVKGSEFILKTIEVLKNEGLKFEFEYISGVSNEQVINKLKEADILIDEAYLFGPGTLSLEAVACGCAVATKFDRTGLYRNVFCYIDVDNLYEPIKKIITDYEYRKKISRDAFDLISKVNNPKWIIDDLLNNSNKKNNIIRPNFYIYHFKLGDERISNRNKKLTKKLLRKYEVFENESIYGKLAEERKI